MVTGHRRKQVGAELKVRNFNLVADVDKKLGGDDEGATPHEIFEASLAACTVITLQMYANRKQMKLESALVTVKIESEGREESVLSRSIQLVGDLSAEEKARLMEIADKCPIHNLMKSKITIRSS